MIDRILKRLSLVLPIVALAACSQSSDKPPVKDTPAEVQLTTGKADIATLYGAVDRQIGPAENAIFSPVGIRQSMGLIHLGARGKTARQIEEYFGLPAGADGDAALAKRRKALLTPAVRVTLRIANALWLADDRDFNPTFIDQAKILFDSGAQETDFLTSPDNAARRINEWSAAQTDGLIPEIVAPGSLAADTALIATNAIFFQGDWLTPFGGGDMHSFLFSDGHEETFYMMKSESRHPFAEYEGWSAIRLPYADERFVMDIMLPQERTTTVPGITPEMLDQLDAQLSAAAPTPIRLLLPRFEAEVTQDLAPALRELGMDLPFSRQNADLSGISANSEYLYVQAMLHSARLQVYERGTRAAATTAAIVTPVSMPPPFEGRDFLVDHPFLFAIRDTDNDAVLFFGRISAPLTYEDTAEEPEKASAQ
ncbi:serpin family protein [Altericroceibacterium endophyticum]|uniref:Serpin domain-containing protein n=1 Tax=Altericroceibacterium endophyticum TaxID=1808508 RepID=A0A6I4T4Y7_9SPHN|nr:serpin family protein [Altericroceibacterium endophyticum]MXO65113.1 hypothetical protein [Altericroceibacterium endophyticum]